MNQQKFELTNKAALDGLLQLHRSAMEKESQDGSVYPFVGVVSVATEPFRDPKRINVDCELKFLTGTVLRYKGEITGIVTKGGVFGGAGSFGQDPEGVRGREVPIHIGFSQIWPVPPIGQAVVHWTDVGTFTGTGVALVGGACWGTLPFR